MDKSFNLFGQYFSIQIRPMLWKKRITTIENLFNKKRYKDAKKQIDLIKVLYPNLAEDPEIIRLETFYSFMNEY